MQFPSAKRLLLIFAPSVIRRPLFSVAAALSLPAKSTNDSFGNNSEGGTEEDVDGRGRVKDNCMIAWERDENWFIEVEAIIRRELPNKK